MTTTINIPFTIDSGNLVLTGTGRTMNTHNPTNDLRDRDPVAYAAMMEFHSLGTTSGTVTVIAV